MMVAIDALEKIRQSTQERMNSHHRGKSRVVVQVGHCSQSVGASEVAAMLKDSLPDTTYLVIAGCDGACFAAPQIVVTDPFGVARRFTHLDPDAAQHIGVEMGSKLPNGDSNIDRFFGKQRRLTLDLCGYLDCMNIDDYILHGGYAGLARALTIMPESVVEEVKASGLRGRGGAYFPAAIKWEGARNVNNSPRYLVVNAEEGEPGIFKDRHLMEGVPHRIIEGAIIAAYASGVSEAFFYVNAEANRSAERVQLAIDQANNLGLLGDDILGSGFRLNIEMMRGAGGYVCGEETTILNTMEGYRREPRLRPPFPTESGVWAKPTVINNCETLASLPFILCNGPQPFAEIGIDNATGTKIISLSGSVQKPGIVEVPMGTTLRHIIYDVGEGPAPGHTLTAVAVGGPSSGILPTSMLDTPIAPGLLHESGVMLGAGGVIGMDERSSVLEAVRNLAAYNADESCGKCTPCREGTPRIVEALDRLMAQHGSPEDLEELKYLADVVGLASLCGLGQAAGGPINSVLHFFGDELALLSGV